MRCAPVALLGGLVAGFGLATGAPAAEGRSDQQGGLPGGVPDDVWSRTPIGTARIEADRTLVLHLISEDNGMIAHAVVRYGLDDPNYAAVATHVGPIGVGEEVLVQPFPEALEQ